MGPLGAKSIDSFAKIFGHNSFTVALIKQAKLIAPDQAEWPACTTICIENTH